MPNASEQFLQFKSAFLSGDMPALGPQRRPTAIAEPELISKLNDFAEAYGVSAAPHRLLHSAALLWHDHLDASHTISQGIETPEGSWLHGIMHRREPDYGNAKYWFHRVGRHAAFPQLAERTGRKTWDPFAFIDDCEAAERGNEAEAVARLREIQAAEFEVLVAHILLKT